jgi:hypothetical protein
MIQYREGETQSPHGRPRWRLVQAMPVPVLVLVLLVGGLAPQVLLSSPAGAVDTSWTPTTAPIGPSNVPPLGVSPPLGFSSVSCPAEGYCVAVTAPPSGGGEGQIDTLIGGTWTATPYTIDGTELSPLGNGLVSFSSVSCWAVGACVAVGFDEVSILSPGNVVDIGITETLSGSVWTGSPAPLTGLSDPALTSDSYGVASGLAEVSCTADGTCAAIGSYEDTSGKSPYYIETLINGAWTATTIPVSGLSDPASANPSASVYSVSCGGAGTCVAVGEYQTASGLEDGLIETLTGGIWRPTATPLIGQSDPASTTDDNVQLTGVSCSENGTCVAIGSYFDENFEEQGLIETLSAGTWTPMTAPLGGLSDPAAANAVPPYLSAVSCPSNGICTAVGQYTDTSGLSQGLIETLADGTWTPTTAPIGGLIDPASASLDTVSCAPGGTCAATGLYGDTSGSYQSLTETLTGGTWTPTNPSLDGLSDPAAANSSAGVGSVSCSTATFCVAVGEYEDTANTNQGLIETLAPIVLDPIGTAGAAMAGATLGQAYSQTLTDAGGTGPYTWSLASGTLPPGLSLDPTTGAISGTPVATGTSDFTIELTDSSKPIPLTVQWATSIDVTMNLSVQPSQTQTGGTAVEVSVDGCPFGPSPAFTYTWTLNTSPLAQSSCNFDLPLNLGSYTLELSATDSAGTSTISQGFTVSPLAGFTYTVEPVPYGDSTSTANVVLNACTQSGGISNYSWNLDSEGSQSSGTACQVSIDMSSGDNTVDLTATGTDGSTLDVSTPIYVDPILAAPTQACSDLSVGSNACWRYGLDWVGDVFGANNDRPPDYALISLGASAGVVSGSVSAIVTCDGSIYVSPSDGTGLSTPYPNAFIAFGYVGDPSTVAPSNADIDGFVSGATSSVNEAAFVTGLTEVYSPKAPGPTIGVEYSYGDTGGGVTFADSYGVLLEQGDGASTCSDGVTASPIWQELTNTPQASGAGLPQITPTSGASTTVGAGVTVNVQSSGWAPGTEVTVTVHSTPVQLTVFPADDAGTSSVNVTIPANLPAGNHTLVETGTGPDGQPRTVTIPFVVPVIHITAASLPAAHVGASYSARLSASGGNPPYTWKLVKGSGTLPKGLKLDKSTGVISGVPSKKGATSTFTVEVLDSKVGKPKHQNAATATFTITVS